MELIAHYGPALLRGFGMTVLCWLVGTACSVVLGLVIALAQRYGPAPLRWLLVVYVEAIRGTPFLVQLYVLYYGGPAFGLRLEALSAGLIGLSIYGSPYFAEIFRSGFNAVPLGQIEAARTIGMSEFAIIRRILLPLALVSSLPALVNFAIILTKETVVLSTITVPELRYQVDRMITETFRYFEATLALALFFWGLVEFVSRLGRWLESRVTHYMIERR
ncbi:amino acid ABC transporter permease [Labrys sp. LIt4]|uniref:Amino acid ABC transporter permease n=1 Tax=Labrys okinawensis TaxID=346911 RepID=A0A2S9QFZ1_9HYPH|nr:MULTISPECIES: amino acid ABC transporter permease [Labrys]MBP0578488.1 amino acid ABC transporter permease [Labrys sp. LIt4]PRH88263.1 amino acid ABC transporter permease [Labrys okinawensis]